MYKKLTDEQIEKLIKAGIDEFADKGYDRASLSEISKAAGLSVGVIYKYYEDKEALFLACVRHCLKALNDVLNDVVVNGDDIAESIEGVIHTLVIHAKENRNINRMYHEITAGGARKYSEILAGEVEGVSSKAYTALIRKAKEEGKVRPDADPAIDAFFVDNLFMMLQFSFCCDYYRERIKLYCGDDIFEDETKLEKELCRFLAGALGIMG